VRTSGAPRGLQAAGGGRVCALDELPSHCSSNSDSQDVLRPGPDRSGQERPQRRDTKPAPESQRGNRPLNSPRWLPVAGSPAHRAPS
jgi:hypothetical protein